MKMSRKETAGIPASRLLSLLPVLSVLAFASGTVADTKSKPTEVPAQVIAHLRLPSAPGSQMVLQKQDHKQYLYIQTASKQTYTVVEVTRPEFPSIVNLSSRSNDTPAGKLDIVGPDVGIAEVPNANAKATIRSNDNPTETVKILDLSDPGHPKVLQTFTGVTSILPEGGRALIYLTNNEGLWILKHSREGFSPAKKKRPCTSEDALAAMPPDCE